MRTIGKKFRGLVKTETIKAIKQRDQDGAGENMRYYGIVNEIVEGLPEEIWQTWEGADGEIRGIAEETIRWYGIEQEI